MSDPLFRIRHRLTAWYVGIFALILGLFGLSALLVMGREMGLQVDRSLEVALDAVERAAAIREDEMRRSADAIDAFEEMSIPGRDLYVFDGAGMLLHPESAPAWIEAAARSARPNGEASGLYEEDETERAWRYRARAFELPSGGPAFVGVAVADNVEVEERYPGLLVAFGIAGTAALVLVAAGGGWLARRATAPAELAFEQMRRFTADAAHELKTPLSVIRSRGEVALRRDRDAEEYRAALQDVTGEASRLGSVVEKMLLLARADAGETALRRDRLFLDDVVENAMVSLRPLARDLGVNVRVEAPREVPVEGDATLLQQLVVILVDNAIQFSPSAGSVTVRVDSAGGRARLQVDDQGPGIPEEALPHVFERFYRVDPSRRREAGSGLGLSIALWITTAHGGRIALRSRDGSGTTAEVDLPAAG